MLPELDEGVRAALELWKKAENDRKEAQEKLDDAVREGDLDLSETTYPHCPSAGVVPKKPPCECRPPCVVPPQTAKRTYGPADTPACRKLLKPESAASSGKGKGPLSAADPGATTEGKVVAEVRPPDEPLPQDGRRTFARGPDGRELEPDRVTVDENGVIRHQYRDVNGRWVTEETYPPQSPVVTGGAVAPSPGTGKSSKETRRRRAEKEPEPKPTMAELREKRCFQMLTEFQRELHRRAREQGGNWTAHLDTVLGSRDNFAAIEPSRGSSGRG